MGLLQPALGLLGGSQGRLLVETQAAESVFDHPQNDLTTGPALHHALEAGHATLEFRQKGFQKIDGIPAAPQIPARPEQAQTPYGTFSPSVQRMGLGSESFWR